MRHTYLLFLVCIFFSNLSAQIPPGQFSRIESAIERGQNFLLNIQHANGAVEDTLNPLFNIWETILAAHALSLEPADSVAVLKALAYLEANRNAANMICHNTSCKNATCLETTVVYYKLLQQTGKSVPPTDSLLARRTPAGYWTVGNPDVREQTYFTSVTAFVLWLHPDFFPGRPEALTWLIGRQNESGHWGSAWEYYGCPAYALWPAVQLLRVENSSEAAMALEKALNYIKNTQQADGSWTETPILHAKRPSPELITAFTLQALTNTTLYESPKVLPAAIEYLLQRQQADGSWDGGYFPIESYQYVKKEYVAATSLCLAALKTYKQWLKS